jgi:hypothetical protein
VCTRVFTADSYTLLACNTSRVRRRPDILVVSWELCSESVALIV